MERIVYDIAVKPSGPPVIAIAGIIIAIIAIIVLVRLLARR